VATLVIQSETQARQHRQLRGSKTQFFQQALATRIRGKTIRDDHFDALLAKERVEQLRQGGAHDATTPLRGRKIPSTRTVGLAKPTLMQVKDVTDDLAVLPDRAAPEGRAFRRAPAGKEMLRQEGNIIGLRESKLMRNHQRIFANPKNRRQIGLGRIAQLDFHPQRLGDSA
jgi:hypothetical protein